MSSSLYIGLMSGTSLDGVDAVLADFSQPQIHILGHISVAMPEPLKQTLFELNSSGLDELHRASLATNALVQLYARATHQLLKQTQRSPSDIAAMGAHGQTVRHQPGLHDGVGYTLQLNQPSLLAELTGIAVVADFRSRDVAAGGQGAPLVPVFHQHVFGSSTQTQAVLNIGGIANLSVLHPEGSLVGFDCGPGNALLDLWCIRHTGQTYDDDGQWARQGQVHSKLLDQFMQEPFLQSVPPKSTGRDLFHAPWLAQQLAQVPDISAVDVQATLTELTALACAQAILRYAAPAARVAVCGGGALNGHLMQRLQTHLPMPVVSSEQCGMPPLQVEAAAFAWLARQTILGLPGNHPQVTGAKGPRILGGIYPA